MMHDMDVSSLGCREAVMKLLRDYACRSILHCLFRFAMQYLCNVPIQICARSVYVLLEYTAISTPVARHSTTQSQKSGAKSMQHMLPKFCAVFVVRDASHCY